MISTKRQQPSWDDVLVILVMQLMNEFFPREYLYTELLFLVPLATSKQRIRGTESNCNNRNSAH